jgi:hypothetical protein
VGVTVFSASPLFRAVYLDSYASKCFHRTPRRVSPRSARAVIEQLGGISPRRPRNSSEPAPAHSQGNMKRKPESRGLPKGLAQMNHLRGVGLPPMPVISTAPYVLQPPAQNCCKDQKTISVSYSMTRRSSVSFIVTVTPCLIASSSVISSTGGCGSLP